MSRGRPISRGGVLALAAAALVGTSAVVGLGTWLDHPWPGAVPGEPAPMDAAGDPRNPPLCPGSSPREGQARQRTRARPNATHVSVAELHTCPQDFDGAAVRFRGEVVGGLLHRSGGVWTQLNETPERVDGTLGHTRSSGIGVLLPPRLAALVDDVGGPGHRGDVLDVQATFARVDDRTGEIAVLLVTAGDVVEQGGPLPVPDLGDRRAAALVALVLAGGVAVAERRAARRR